MNIHTIDLFYLGNPNAIASYLIESEAGPILVETGPRTCVDALTAGLAKHGYKPSDVKHILLTHIHFDHAGGAGWWAQQGAHIYVHNIGAKHMIDPSRLYASALRIYGDKMETLYGELIPIPEEQVTLLYDQDVIEIGEHKFIAHDTPGHANHHMSYQLEDIAFTGDVASMVIYLPTPWLKIVTPPPEFNLEKWHVSLERLKSLNLSAIYPTHFGRIEDPLPHFEAVASLINHGAQFVKNGVDSGQSREEIIAAYRAHQEQIALSNGADQAMWDAHQTNDPIDMSIDGIIRYWRKKAEAEAAG